MLAGITPSSPLPFSKIGYIYHGTVHAIHKLTHRAPKERRTILGSGKRSRSGVDASLNKSSAMIPSGCIKKNASAPDSAAGIPGKWSVKALYQADLSHVLPEKI